MHFEKIDHIAFVMDGNGRWAKQNNKSKKEGHEAGADNMQNIVKHCFDMDIRYVTVYALSAENLVNRPQSELDDLFDIVRHSLKNNRGIRQFEKQGVRVEFVGDLNVFPKDIQEGIADIRQRTAGNSKTLLVAFNYGARQEIVQAVNLCVDMNKRVSVDSFAALLYTKNVPEVDMVVRTGGEIRLSNFLLYQVAYSELFFCDTLWPSFGVGELDAFIEQFYKRKRNFGA